MKKQERYKLLNYVKKDYSERFMRNYEFKKLSKKALYELLQQNKHSSMSVIVKVVVSKSYIFGGYISFF